MRPEGWSWSPTEHFAPMASIWKHSNWRAAGFFNEWKSPHEVWNRPVMPMQSRPRVRAYRIEIGKCR